MGDTLEQALESVFQASVPLGGQQPPSSGTSPTPSAISVQIQSLINEANNLAQKIQTDLKNGDLGQYQADVNTLATVIQQLQQAAAGSSSTGSGGASGTKTGNSGSSSGASGVALRRR
jgi:uncharacterized membrane protein (UPF0182 family)